MANHQSLRPPAPWLPEWKPVPVPGERLLIHQWSHLRSRRECDHKRTGPCSVPVENLGKWRELEIRPHHFAEILAAVGYGDPVWSENSGKRVPP